jgi:hypothetical protein
MLITVTNPIDNSEVEVELTIQLNIMVLNEQKTLNVTAFGSKEV